ncbi:hypothetical protein M0802_009475 [Mischocyttarus mexicanus]|nr:hypothetical protein M0802_009475 [Mischocyttarus mexicanus]
MTTWTVRRNVQVELEFHSSTTSISNSSSTSNNPESNNKLLSLAVLSRYQTYVERSTHPLGFGSGGGGGGGGGSTSCEKGCSKS